MYGISIVKLGTKFFTNVQRRSESSRTTNVTHYAARGLYFASEAVFLIFATVISRSYLIAVSASGPWQGLKFRNLHNRKSQRNVRGCQQNCTLFFTGEVCRSYHKLLKRTHRACDAHWISDTWHKQIRNGINEADSASHCWFTCWKDQNNRSALKKKEMSTTKKMCFRVQSQHRVFPRLWTVFFF